MTFGETEPTLHPFGFIIYQYLHQAYFGRAAWQFINGRVGDPLAEAGAIDITHESEVGLNTLPSAPITKMTKKEHVDRFFSEGQLRLGSFESYRQYDHKEIGDVHEGRSIIISQNGPLTHLFDATAGFNYYVFCGFIGAADQQVVQDFGYDDAYQINDPASFAEAIAAEIGAVATYYSPCLYKDHTVIVTNQVVEQPGRISGKLATVGSAAKYFIKHSKYSKQREYRFIWQMPTDVRDARNIICPAANKFCSR